MTWNRISPKELADNPFRLIGDDWTLITAGTPAKWNTMTASWGGLGVLWGRPVSFIFVRPTRHTYGFLEEASRYTLSFFDEKYRSALNHCGKVSGREHDKAAETGLEPIPLDHQTCPVYRPVRIDRCGQVDRLIQVHRPVHIQRVGHIDDWIGLGQQVEGQRHIAQGTSHVGRHRNLRGAAAIVTSASIL